MYACLDVFCHLHFWQNYQSFTCHWGNLGVERTPNKSQHTTLTLEKKILPPLLPEFVLTTFWSQVRCCTDKLSGLPLKSALVNDKVKERDRNSDRCSGAVKGYHVKNKQTWALCFFFHLPHFYFDGWRIDEHWYRYRDKRSTVESKVFKTKQIWAGSQPNSCAFCIDAWQWNIGRRSNWGREIVTSRL